MADAWTELTVAAVQDALPSDLATLYASWVEANPSKGTRLGDLVVEVRKTFRTAVVANPANRSSEADGLITRADIWLRMVQNGGIPIDSMAGEGSPSYRPPDEETWLL